MSQSPAEHSRERDAVRASLLLADTRSERHGVYVLRRPPVVVVARPGHVFVIPTVWEKLL
jgi:hypothetical protein